MKEEEARPIEASGLLSSQPQPPTGILEQCANVLRRASNGEKGVLLARCPRAGARQQPNEDARRAAREPVHFNIGIQPLSAQIPPLHDKKSRRSKIFWQKNPVAAQIEHEGRPAGISEGRQWCFRVSCVVCRVVKRMVTTEYIYARFAIGGRQTNFEVKPERH
jgi:hypothetical protein